MSDQVAVDFVKLLNEEGLSEHRRPVELPDGFSAYSRDLAPMKLHAGHFVPFLIPRELNDQDTTPEQFYRALDTAIGMSRDERGPIVMATSAKTPDLTGVRDRLQRHSVAVLDKTLMNAFKAARDRLTRYRLLGEALTRHLGRLSLNPYLSGTPAHGGLFFGRKSILDQIIQGKTIRSCTIVGNRRIGKTSVLHEVKDQLKISYGERLRVLDLYASKCENTWDAISIILSQLDVRVPTYSDGKAARRIPAIIKRFPGIMRAIAERNEFRIVLLIDEFDPLLEIDERHGYEFLRLLREVVHTVEGGTVLIAGFRRLMEARVRQSNEFFNLTPEVVVPKFNRHETEQMVKLPLQRLSIDTSKHDYADLIYRETRGYPELIQMYCNEIVHYCDTKGQAPSEAHLKDAVLREREFERTILHTFLNNTNATEQLVCYILFHKALQDPRGVVGYEFHPTDDVVPLLEQWQVSDLDISVPELCENLVVGSVFERVTGTTRYRITIPQLARYCERLNLPGSIDSALKRVRRETGHTRRDIYAQPAVEDVV